MPHNDLHTKTIATVSSEKSEQNSSATASAASSTSNKNDILRYPYADIHKDTDYLQIEVIQYKKLGITPQENILLEGLKSSKDNYGKKELLKTILLPIPQNIQDSNGAGWGEDSLNTLAAYGVGAATDVIESNNYLKGIVDAIKTTAGDLKSLAVSGEGNKLTNTFFASAAANVLGANTSFSGLLARSSGQIINPNTELLFNGVKLRSFNFSFDFAPRNATEAGQVKEIIRTFKKNMAPTTTDLKTDKTSSKGLFLKSPNVFQLTYRSGNSDHPFLNKFVIAALTNMQVNYTGSGTYMTYSDNLKSPVHMKMDLSFQELSPVYSEDYTDVGGVGY